MNIFIFGGQNSRYKFIKLCLFDHEVAFRVTDTKITFYHQLLISDLYRFVRSFKFGVMVRILIILKNAKLLFNTDTGHCIHCILIMQCNDRRHGVIQYTFFGTDSVSNIESLSHHKQVPKK